MLTVAPPTGTVTFLFTDMEGSTRLWDEHPDAMNTVLERHDDLLGSIVDRYDGYVFSRAGDGWGIAFGSASAAVHAALEIQDQVATEPWPAPIEAIRLRMGLHAGTANQREGDFFGTTVNRAARVSAAAHGGQVFVTDAVRALIADAADAPWQLHDLGEHRLRDLTRPEHLWQIDTGEGDAAIADLTPRALTGNLPKPGATIVGRDGELAAMASELDDAPVLTLVGVGGVGKTTLAVEAARRLAEDLDISAWFADLTTVEDEAEVAPSIAAAIGATRRTDMGDLEGLVDALRTERRIVVVDNAEHLVASVASVIDAVATGAPDTRVIVTSREPLSIRDEVVHRVPPLTTDSDSSGATTLFIERARAVAPDLEPTAFPIDVIERICRHLDGLPLAIELAAAQAETMTPREILAALEADNLAMRSDSRSVTARHRSLDDLVRWSYDRLDPTAQRVFERLSIFAGGATAGAADAVCGGDVIEADAVRNALRTLVRTSMVTTTRAGGQTRFGMLETLHRFAAHRREQEATNAGAPAIHARWFADFAEDVSAGMGSPSEGQWLTAAVREFDNLEAAARWACANGDYDVLATIGTCLPALLESRIPPGTDSWIELARTTLPADHPGRAHYAYAAAYLRLFRGDLSNWLDGYDEDTAGVADIPQVGVIRDCLRLISAFFLGDMETVIADSAEVSRRAYAIGDQRMGGSIIADYGLALLFEGRSDEAWAVTEDLRVEAEAGGIPSVLAWALYLLGELEAQTDPDSAIEHFEESVEYGVSIENEFTVGISLIALASTAGRADAQDIALDAIYRAVRLWHGAGNRPQFWTAIRNLVEILHRLGADADAYRLHLATEAAADQAPKVFGPYGDLYRGVVAETRNALDPAEVERIERSRPVDYHGAAELALDAIGRLAPAAR